MPKLNRRSFIQLSTTALLASGSMKLEAAGKSPEIATGEDGSIKVTGPGYVWSWSAANDTFELHDSKGRSIVRGPLQPAITVERQGKRICSPGKAAKPQVEQGRIKFSYQGVNGTSSSSLVWRFDGLGFWTDPVVYRSAADENVVSLHYFAKMSRGKAVPSLHCTYLVIPGINEGPAISPIQNFRVGLDETVWLGRGAPGEGMIQQWGLPAHFFSGFSLNEQGPGTAKEYSDGISDSFLCGLADLPNGDLLLSLRREKSSLWMDYRGDLWKFLHGPGDLKLGATLFWTVGAGDYKAIGRYYEGLVQAHTIKRKENSPRKTSIALMPQVCTWGAQVSQGKGGDKLDQAFLEEVYGDLKSSGMQAKIFSIDDKWEGKYGNLRHSAKRFPHFEQFLDKVRADGLGIGIWAALMRCEDPSDMGLTEENMLQRTDGTAYKAGGGAYYILDCTQPKVADVLSRTCRDFIRRYKPDLVKFDFGYEIPPMSVAAPKDRAWAGERLLWKGLDVTVGAMKQENPDLVVMYYQLSPLFMDYFDLHSPDDLFMAAGDYDIEANRRFYFSSLLGELGVPTYGSSGYDWASMPNIWLDSAVVGTVGSLNDFKCDERGKGVTPELAAMYNGVAKALRSSNRFHVEPIGAVEGAAVRGAHGHSWVRVEAGEPVLVAFRPSPVPSGIPFGSRSKFEDAIQANVPAVVASRTDQGIGEAESLAVVPFGNGDIWNRRKQGAKAQLVSHYFGGASSESGAPIEGGKLRLTTRMKNEAGAPIEWIEVRIS